MEEANQLAHLDGDLEEVVVALVHGLGAHPGVAPDVHAVAAHQHGIGLRRQRLPVCLVGDGAGACSAITS